MAIAGLRHLIRQAAAHNSLGRSAIMRVHRQRFLSSSGLGGHFGVYQSFAEARATLPASNEFNQASLADEYLRIRTRQVFEYDYPVLWWLQHAFALGATRVLDLGGSVGVHYYAYSRYLKMPRDLSWCVVEVPAIVEIGRAESQRRGPTALSFTDDIAQAGGCDIVISAGALHYLENGRPAQILRLQDLRPRHVLLNKLPLFQGKSFVSTQNIGDGCFAPVHVYNREDFIGEFEGIGYKLSDHWTVHERSMEVPGHPDCSFPNFGGLYLSR